MQLEAEESVLEVGDTAAAEMVAEAIQGFSAVARNSRQSRKTWHW